MANFFKKIRTGDKKMVFKNEQTFLPIQTSLYIQKISKELKMPVSRLIAYAVDKELESENPFSYEIFFDTDKKRKKNEYAHEANLLLKFMKQTSFGLSIDQIILCRRDIGVIDKERLIGGYIELLEAGVIEEYPHQGKTFKFDESYAVAKIKSEFRK